MYNDQAYINKRNIFYRKYFADVLCSGSVEKNKQDKNNSPFVFEYTIDISTLSQQDCYRIASYQRALFFRSCFFSLKEKVSSSLSNFVRRIRKSTVSTSHLDA